MNQRRRWWFRAGVWLGVAVLAVALAAGVNLSRVSALGAIAVAESSAEPGGDPAASAQLPSGPAASAAPERSRSAQQVDPAWVTRVSARVGIAPRALLAYANAALISKHRNRGCGLSWNTLAGLGQIESAHGTTGGSVLGADGRSRPAIRGPVLDGRRTAAISDSDRGRLDGNTRWDRAVGPMQFLPGTWRQWGADGNGDGVADPDQLDDAALAAADYLCAAGGDLTTGSGWTAAIWAYNHSADYVAAVRAAANQFAAAA